MDDTANRYYAPEVDPRYSPQAASPSLHGHESFHNMSHMMGKQDDDRPYGYAGYSHTGHSSYGSSNMKEATAFMQQDRAEAGKERRRCFGMRRGVFIVVLAVIILLVIAGVVLGVVFGVVLPKQNTSSGVKVIEKTGLATATAADDSRKTFVYFQDSDNNIYENSYFHGEWSLDDESKTNGGIVTSAAAPKSPLAAVSYQNNDQTYRQVFFITSNGKVKTVTRSETSGWSSPKELFGEATVVNSMALAACADEQLGILVFYGATFRDEVDAITAIHAGFNSDDWFRLWWFYESDPISGVACSTHSNAQLNLYVRNSTSKAVEQQYFSIDKSGYSFVNSSPGRSKAEYPIASGSDMALCEDDHHTEYVFWQEESGRIIRGTVNPRSFHFEDYHHVPHTEGASIGSKMAASYVGGGSFLMYQEQSSASEVSTVGMDRNNGLLTSGVMSG